MNHIENYLEERLKEIHLKFLGEIINYDDHYYLEATALNEGRITFENTIFDVLQVNYSYGNTLFFVLKIKESSLKNCIDKVTPLN